MRKPIWFIILIFLLLPSIALQQLDDDTNQVALLIGFADGDYATECVSFVEPTISGTEVLQRSGLVIDVDNQFGGSAVCSIDNVGCPATDCFCQCRNSENCKFWTYWNLNDQTWQQSASGADFRQLSPGDVDGWLWNVDSPPDIGTSPSLLFAEICTPEAVRDIYLPAIQSKNES